MTFLTSQGHATPLRAGKSHATKTRTPTSPIAELFLYRTHSAAVGHARHGASSDFMSIVDAHNDEALVCGSIVEETRSRDPHRCSHRVFSLDVKSAAIARVLDDGYDARVVAAEFEVSHASLRRWVTQALPTRTEVTAEPFAWVVLPEPRDCTGPEDAEPSEPPTLDPPASDPPAIDPPAPPEEAPPPPEQAPPPQEFPPASEPDMDPSPPPEQAPPPEEIPPASYA